MANLYTANTARFKPFSFQEMLQPYQIYTEAYNKVDEELANLDIMAGDVASKLSSTDDAELVQKATSFQTDLNKTMEDLYNKGLNPTTKKQLAKLKARYTQEMNPINEAYKLYQEDQKYLAKMAVEHPEILIEGAGKSVSDYMSGKAPQMRSVNTDDLMNEALNLAKTQAGRTYRESGWTPTAGGRFLERTVETGLNDIDFNNALAFVRNPNLTAEDFGMNESQFNTVKNNAILLGTSINEIINTPSYAGLSNANKQKALNSIMKGIRAGFQYDKKTATESDPIFAHNLRIAEADYEQQLKARAKYLETLNEGIIPTEAIDRGSTTQGDYLKDQDNFVKTLVTTSQGVSTADIESKKTEFNQLQAELKAIKDEYGVPSETLNKSTKKESIPNTSVGGYAGLAGSATRSSLQERTFTKDGKKIKVNSTNDVAYDRYFEIQDRLSKLPNEIQSELDKVQILVDKYGYLSDNLQEAITKGHQLELNQSSINGIYIKPIIDPTLDKKVKTNIIDIAKGMSSEEGAIKEITNDGKVEKVSQREISEILNNSSADDFIILTNPSLDNNNIPNPVVLRYTNTGKKQNRDFVLSAASTLNNFANSYKNQVSFIRDYSKKGLEKIADLPIDSYTLAVDYEIAEGVENTVLPESIKNIVKNTKTSLGSDRFGYTIKTQNSPNAPSNIFKIITKASPYGEIIVGVSSLNNEASIYDGGVGSGTFAKKESQRYINDLIKTLQ